MPNIFKSFLRPAVNNYIFPDAESIQMEEPEPEEPAEPMEEPAPAGEDTQRPSGEEERQNAASVISFAKVQADQIVADAHRQAEELMEEGRRKLQEEAETAREEVRNDGYRQGYTEGLRQAQVEGARAREEQSRQEAEQVQSFLREASSARDQLLDQAQDDLCELCLAVAEKYALEKKRVLVLLTDMTNFADAMKEIAITMEQIPSNRGYPGDLYSQLAARYEKAVDFDGAGSITILTVTTMPGDDVTHPIPDNTGYITEGQFYLKNGRIEPFGSLSRLKQQVNGKTREDHRAIMDTMIRFYADYKETLEKQSMGFQMSNWDKKLLRYGVAFEKQMMDLSVNIPLEEALDEGWKILAECFDKTETGIKTELVEKFWPK